MNKDGYIFVHNFYDAGTKVISVDLSIRGDEKNLVKIEILSDHSDIIGTTAGGNRCVLLVYVFDICCLNNVGILFVDIIENM